MKNLLYIAFILTGMQLSAQQVSYKTFAEVDSFLHGTQDTTYVINLWATWCKPCVAELPYFGQADSIFEGKAVRIILLSLDAQNRWESALIPFLDTHDLQAEVWAMYAERPADWIDRIAPEWSGAIPGTLIFNPARSKRIFIENEIDLDTLTSEIQNILH